MLILLIGALESIIANLQGIGLVLLIFGLCLIVLEIFTPGFGIPGAAGITLLFISILLTAKTLLEGMIMLCMLLAVIAILLGIIINRARKGKLARGIILDKSGVEEEKLNMKDMEYFIGKTGITTTQLRPSGVIDLEGVKLDVVSKGTFIEKGVEVKVIGVDGIRIVVQEI